MNDNKAIKARVFLPFVISMLYSCACLTLNLVGLPWQDLVFVSVIGNILSLIGGIVSISLYIQKRRILVPSVLIAPLLCNILLAVLVKPEQIRAVYYSMDMYYNSYVCRSRGEEVGDGFLVAICRTIRYDQGGFTDFVVRIYSKTKPDVLISDPDFVTANRVQFGRILSIWPGNMQALQLSRGGIMLVVHDS